MNKTSDKFQIIRPFLDGFIVTNLLRYYVVKLLCILLWIKFMLASAGEQTLLKIMGKTNKTNKQNKQTKQTKPPTNYDLISI